MSSLLVASIAIRLAAITFGLVWSLVLLRRLRDWRHGLFALTLVLMAVRETLSLLGKRDSGILNVISGAGEMPGIGVSIVAALAVFFLGQMFLERLQSEHAVRASERRFRRLFENSAEAITLLDATGAVIYAGPSNKRLWGFSGEEVVGRSGFEFIHPDDREDVMRLLTRLLEGPEESINAQFRLIAKDGSWHDTEAIGRNLLADPSVQAIVVNYRDITERKRAEDLVLQSERKFSTIFQNIPDGVAITRLEDGMILDVNESFVKRSGYSRSEAIGKSDLDLGLLVNLQDRQRQIDTLRTKGELQYDEVVYKFADGSIAIALVSARTVEIDDALCGVFFAKDITELRQAEALLRQSEAKFRALAETTSSAIAMLQDDKIRYVNPALEMMTGYSNNELLGMTLWDVVPPDSRDLIVQGRMGKQTGELSSGRGEFKIVTKSGEERWINYGVGVVEFEGRPTIIATASDITERKLAERALRESEQRFAAFMNNTSAQTWMKDADLRYVYANDPCGQPLGVPAEEIVAKCDFDLWPRETAEMMRANDRAALDSNESSETFDRFSDRSGQVRHSRVFRFPFTDAAGRRFVGGMAIDVTQQKEAEEALRKSEANLAAAQAIARLGSWEFDLATRTGSGSAEMFRILGRDPAQGLLPFAEFLKAVHPADREAVLRAEAQAVADHQPYQLQYRIVRNDGSLHWIEANVEPVCNDANEFVRFVGTAQDITNRKLAEEALRESEKRLRTIVEGTRALLVSVDANGHFTFANDAAVEAVGYRNPSELVGRPYLHFVHPEDRHRVFNTFLNQANSYQPSCMQEFRLVDTAGRVKWFSFLSSLEITDGQVVGQSGVAQDITERKRAEERLRQLSGRLLSLQDDERRRIARQLHDTIAQSLAALAMNLSLLEASTTELEPRARSALTETLALADSSAREIRTLSYLLHPPLLDEMGLPSAVRWYVDGFGKRSGIQVELDAPDELGRLPSDVETALFRILQECLTNVHRHSGSPKVRIVLARDSTEVVLDVEDEGRGMPPEMLESGGGSIVRFGVGIAGMRERVRELGGSLEIRPGERGTTVRAILPLTEVIDERGSDSARG